MQLNNDNIFFQYLSMEQQGMEQLIATIIADVKCLKIIKDGMSELVGNHSTS